MRSAGFRNLIKLCLALAGLGVLQPTSGWGQQTNLTNQITQVTNALWSAATGGPIYGAPAVGIDGTVYIGSYDGKLYAFTASGTNRWSFQTGGQIYSSPAIGTDGTIYFGSLDKKLYAVSPSGTKRWEFATQREVASSPAISGDGTVYVGSLDGNLYAVTSDGTEKWQFSTGSPVYSSPAISTDGTIYFGSYNGKVYALTPNGRTNWVFATGGVVHSSPALGPDDVIYVGSADGNLYALNPDGTQRWLYTSYAPIYSSPAVALDGTVYFGGQDYRLYAIRPNGSKKWEFLSYYWIYSSPALASDGTVYIGGLDYRLYAVDTNGKPKWQFVTGNQVNSSPAIGLNGAIYFGSLDGNVYAVPDTNALAKAPWPMFRRNLAHTAAGFVRRTLPAEGYSPGRKLLVSLAATPPLGSTVYDVEDRPPAGWLVGNMSSSGFFDGVDNLVKFGPFFDAMPRTLLYEITPPQNQTGPIQFSGFSSADGLDNMVGGSSSLTLVPLHPADSNPTDGQMSIEELTAYGAAWKRGVPWTNSPSPIPVSYVTQAASLWKGGEYYRWNSNLVSAPQWWVNRTNAPPPDVTNSVPVDYPSGTGGSVAEVQMARAYQAGMPLPVNIAVNPSPASIVYAVEDLLPAGWTASNISSPGLYDALTQKVKWGPFFDTAPRSFSFVASPPANATGPASFTGLASIDGTNFVFYGQQKTTDKPIPPVLGPLLLATNGDFQVTFYGDSGFAYSIQASSDLTDWTTLTNFFSTNITSTFEDRNSTNYRQRFYRVVLP